MEQVEKEQFLAYAGIGTMWRAPQTRDIRRQDVVVMGVPFDCGTSNRSGARLGPRAIRQMSLHTGNFYHPWPYDIRTKLRFVDYGDVGMTVKSDMTTFMVEDTYRHADQIFSAGARLFSLGGDHTIPYGMVRAAKQHFGKIAIVHFDSHQDSLTSDNGDAIFHGSFAHDLASEGTVDASRSTQVFIRTDMPNECGYNIVYAREALKLSPEEVAERIKRNAGDAPVYITFDIDALDPAFAPGTGTPVPGGPSMAFVREVLINLNGLNVVGGDVVEVAPTFDHAELTALAAATIAGDIVHLIGESVLRA